MGGLVMAYGYGKIASEQRKAGVAAKHSAYIEAAQLDDKADVVRGATQRDAIRERQIADYTGSTALAAAGGASCAASV